MYPRLGGIENLEGFPLYNPMLVLAVAVCVFVLLRLLAREGFAPKKFILYIGVLGLGGFLGAKLYSIIFQGGFRGIEIEVAGGWRYPGSILGLLVSSFVGRRFLPDGVSVGRFLDALAPAYAFAIAIGRIGCLLWGCCHGAVCHLPWALSYPRGSIAWWDHYDAGVLAAHAAQSLPVHPLPLYLFFMEFALAFLLLWLRGRKRYNGQVMLLFLAIHGVLKFGLEYFRDPFHVLHQIVLLIAFGAIAILYLKRNDADPERI